ncbi:glycosyltransferase family 87 protein [Actinokineospora bangkokensis]|uniref:glycosyltransferase family 87 protein n=1 Tax=Actinokineospora bangkokensis TaxID=1193682 RepID=UPI00096B5A64|nr:glycosyltransferase family 87 protein [Actinokineospora bangkokensis]
MLVGIVFTIGVEAWREVTYYQRWHDVLSSGTFPVDDVTWQYPPGAALVMLLPKLLPFAGYVPAFVACVVAVDAVVAWALARAVLTTGGPTAAPWLWVLGIPALLTTPFTRYDVIVTGVVVLGLLALRGRPRLAGVLAGLGASVKVWPAVVLLGARWRSWWWALATAVGLCAVLALTSHNAFGFLSAQSNRGLEIESVGGSVLMAAALFGYPAQVEYRYGSFEVLGPLVPQIATGCVVASAVAALWIGVWRLRTRSVGPVVAADAALTAVLLFVVTSRVISPQYVIWLVGLGAVCLVSRQTTQRPVVALIAVMVPLTSLEFPLLFNELLKGSAPAVVAVLVRNAVLLVAAVWSAVLLHRGYRRRAAEPVAVLPPPREEPAEAEQEPSERSAGR